MMLLGLNARRVLERASDDVNRFMGKHWGDKFPYYFVCEYPKSGGTWLSRMIADYLKIPFPQHSIFPVGCAAVIQNHWGYHPRFRRVVYLYRDGRDVMVSDYFQAYRVAYHSHSNPDAAQAKITRHRHQKLFGKEFGPQDIERLLQRFIEHRFERPGMGHSSWSEHVQRWGAPEGHSHVVYVSYEQLLDDCNGTLRRIVEQLTEMPADEWQLNTTVDKFSMRRMTGRTAGTEDAQHVIRKGIAGDWQSYFTREAAEVFNSYAGDVLVHLGYEKDKHWVDRYDLPRAH